MRDEANQALVLRNSERMRLSTVRDFFRDRFDRSQRRLDRAVSKWRDSFKRMSLEHQVDRQPMRWFGGALLVGFALSLLTAPRRPRR